MGGKTKMVKSFFLPGACVTRACSLSIKHANLSTKSSLTLVCIALNCSFSSFLSSITVSVLKRSLKLKAIMQKKKDSSFSFTRLLILERRRSRSHEISTIFSLFSQNSVANLMKNSSGVTIFHLHL